MSLPTVLERIAELHSVLAPKPARQVDPAAFLGTLQSAQAGLAPGMAAPPLAPTAAPLQPPIGGTPAGQAVLNLVRGEVGQAEQPPGSNDSPRIAQYRQATVGSGVGPWCAYFTSWAAREAGVPLGDAGQGFGRVDDVYAWAQRAGKAIPAGSGTPQPCDLVVWDEHIGVVESVLPDGRIQTVEGNSSDQVSRRVHDASGGGAIGYVRLG
ncbi:MAG: CHAP domain-containing protein [Solirubrobacteraceae bacterium]